MNGIAASTTASGARFGRTRIAAPIRMPETSGLPLDRERRQPERRRQDVVHRLHRLVEHDRARRRQDRRRRAGDAAGELPRDRERRQHEDERGDWRQPEDRVLSEQHRQRRHQQRHSRRADRRCGIGVKRRGKEPAGRQRQRHVGPWRIGKDATRLQFAARERLRHQRVAGRIRSAHRPRAAHDRNGGERQGHGQGDQGGDSALTPRPCPPKPRRRRVIC